MMYAIEMARHIHTRFRDNRFWNSSNIKGITSTTCKAVVLVVLTRGIYELRCRGYLRWHDISIKSHGDRFRHSSTIKRNTSTVCEAIVLVLLMRSIYDSRH
jgi:hypothetical protein